jgi:hypothetical protein
MHLLALNEFEPLSKRIREYSGQVLNLAQDDVVWERELIDVIGHFHLGSFPHRLLNVENGLFAVINHQKDDEDIVFCRTSQPFADRGTSVTEFTVRNDKHQLRCLLLHGVVLFTAQLEHLDGSKQGC